MMNENKKHFFFLLGAGSSKPANIPLVTEFVGEFEKDLENRGKNKKDIHCLTLSLREIRKQWEAQKRDLNFDLEILYEILCNINLHDTSTIPLGLAKFEPFFPKTTETVFLEAELIKYIQKRCYINNPKKVEYLKPILNFHEISDCLDIVSLNYDSCIEQLCASHGITCIDGFDDEGNWNPDFFEKSESKQKIVRLFKLHGSVTWYAGPHLGYQYKRIPKRSLFAIGEEGIGRAYIPNIDAIMIYPGVGKQITFGPSVELLTWFRRVLRQSNICIAMGYRFGDPHIRRNILEALHLNQNLRLALISGCSSKKLAASLIEVGADQSRVIPISKKIPEVFENDELLKRTKKWLNGETSTDEKDTWKQVIENLSAKYKAPCMEKATLDYDNLWGIAVEPDGKYAYLTQEKGGEGQLLQLDLEKPKWSTIATGLRRPRGVAWEGDHLYVIEAEYREEQGEPIRRDSYAIQKKEGYGRLWRIYRNGKQETITYLGSQGSSPPLTLYQDAESQGVWQDKQGVLRWPDSVVVEKPEEVVLVTETHRLSRIDLKRGSISTALHITLCMNLVDIAFLNDNKNVLLLEAGWWELERGQHFSTTGYGRLLQGNLKTGALNEIRGGFTKARGLLLMPCRTKTLVSQSHPYPHGQVCEVDLKTGEKVRSWSGLDAPHKLALVPNNSIVLIACRDGLWRLNLRKKS